MEETTHEQVAADQNLAVGSFGEFPELQDWGIEGRVTVKEAAEVAGMTPSGICYLIKTGKLSSVQVKGRHYIDAAQLETYLAAHPKTRGGRKATKKSTMAKAPSAKTILAALNRAAAAQREFEASMVKLNEALAEARPAVERFEREMRARIADEIRRGG